MSASNSEGIKMAPPKSIQDFVSDLKQGYTMPTFNDFRRLSNRITSNLLYFQTNYFVVGALIFTLFVLFAFNKVFVGALGVATTIFVIMFARDKIPQLSSLKAQYPIAVIGLGLFNLLIVYSTFRCILMFTMSLGIPFSLCVVHAAMRKRGIKNKVSNKVEQISGGQVYHNTPMGIFLSAIGFEAKEFDD